MGDAALLQRLVAREIGRDEALCDRVDEHPWGRAFLTPSLPLVWDMSWVLIERPGLTAPEVAAAADEAIGNAGMRHRVVFMPDPEEADRLAPGFGELGWEVERDLYMVLRRPPDREPEAEFAEVRLGAIEEMRLEFIRGDLPLPAEVAGPTAEQLLELDRRVGEYEGDRWFVAPAGAPQAACRLLSRGGVGQVEDVFTMPAARERGLARAVVTAALRASKAKGDELTYITANADDWPRLLYAKLGFDEIGVVRSFRRKP